MDRRYTIGWATGMMRVNLRAAIANRGMFVTMSLFMAFNNVLWLGVPYLFFHIAGDLRGWSFSSMAVLYGISAFSFGIGFVIFGGAWRMVNPIADGTLDIHLGRPRPVLLSLMLSRLEMTAMGDVLSGLFIMIAFGHLNAAQFAGAVGLGIMAASVFVSANIAISSLTFWTGNANAPDQLADAFIGLSSMPLHGLPLPVRVLLFSILPAGFVAFLPASILQHFTWGALFAMIAAALVFPCLAAFIFHQGLRRYTSGNRMVEIR